MSETLAAVLTREVDWKALPPDVPSRLHTLLRDCLVRDPKQRLRDIGDARRVLDQIIGGVPDTLAAAPAPQRLIGKPVDDTTSEAMTVVLNWQARLKR